MPKCVSSVSLSPEIMSKAKERKLNVSAVLEAALRAEFADTSPMDEKIRMANIDIEMCREALARATTKATFLREAKTKLAEDDCLAKEKAEAEAKQKEIKLAQVRTSLIGWVKEGKTINWQHYLAKYGITEQEIKGLIENEVV